MTRRLTRRSFLIASTITAAGAIGASPVLGAKSPTSGTTSAATATLAVTPTSALPGAALTISGSGFGWHQKGTLTFDGAQIGTFSSNNKGAFSKQWTLPTGAASGTHTLTATTPSVSASTSLTVQAVQTTTTTATPSPSPTATPSPSPTPSPTPSPSPTGASIYWGAWVDNSVPWDMTKVTYYEQEIGKGFSIIHFGQPWVMNGQYQSFPSAALNTVRQHGSIPLLDWSSWYLGQGAYQPNFADAKIAAGAYDSYIQQWAQAAKAWGEPMFLRFDWEMNIGGQFPWNYADGNNTAADYVAMWRHVHDIFTTVGARNVTWVWCPNVYWPGSYAKPFDVAYPGDAYVDWTALDGYNSGGTTSSWMSFASIFQYPYNDLVSLTGKPIMIGETGCVESGGNKAAWITDMLQVQVPKYFPRIKAVVWFNMGGSAIDTSQTSLSAFAQSIGLSYYPTNQFAGITTSPIPLLS